VPDAIGPFCQEIPQIDMKCLGNAGIFLDSINLSLIPAVTVREVMAAIHGRTLEEEATAGLLKWAASLQSQLSSRDYYELISTLQVPVGDGTLKKSLSRVSFFPPSFYRDVSNLLPESCLAFSLSEKLPDQFGLKALSVLEWVDSLATVDLSLAERVLFFLQYCWKARKVDGNLLKDALYDKRWIPTTQKVLLSPREVYLSRAAIIGDLPVVDLALSESFLLAIGVQERIEVAVLLASIETLSWSHIQLARYLASVRDTLSSDEVSIIKAAPIFPSDNGTKFRLSELFVDSVAARTLSLPRLQWSGTESSDAIRFLFDMGLRLHPPARLVLSQPSLLPYFLEHFYKHYRAEYAKDASLKTIPFVPLIKEGDRASPKDCFVDEDLALLGFNVIHPDMKQYVEGLHVAKRPSPEMVIERLVSTELGPGDASRIFAYFSSDLSYFSGSQMRMLSKNAFVPILQKDSFVRFAPCSLFLSSGNPELAKYFRTVDFGHGARPFLQACVFQDEPKPANIAILLAENGINLLKDIGVSLYLDLLRLLAVNLHGLDKQAISLLSTTSCLLGLSYEHNGREEEETTASYTMESASQVYIADDVVSQRLFKILSAPLDPLLEKFYIHLGCRHLSKQVKTECKISLDPFDSEQSALVQKLIRSRAPLLMASKPQKKAAIKSLQQVCVKEIERISIIRIFNDERHEEPTTATFHKDLLITKQVDYYDVASSLCPLIFAESVSLPDILLVSTILSSTLESLRRKGFDVDRLLVTEEASKPPIIRETKIVNPKERAIPETELEAPRSSNESKPQIPEQPDIRSYDSRNAFPGFLSSMKNVIKSKLRSSPTTNEGRKETPTDKRGPIATSTDERGRPMPAEGIRSIPTPSMTKTMLRESLSSMRSETSTEIYDLPQMRPFRESNATSFCEFVPGSELSFHGEISGIKFFLAKSAAGQIHLLKDYFQPFLLLIDSLVDIFEDIPRNSVNVFYDPTTVSIAFNRSHSLFFNIAHYLRQVEATEQGITLKASWYLTFCHELAHNFVQYGNLFFHINR